jgi:ribosomal protein S27E
MADLRRRISHLQDLADRYQVKDGGREGRLLAEMVEVMREMALDVEEVSANQIDLEEYLEEVDSDLMSLEEDVYDEDDDDEDDDEDDFQEIKAGDDEEAEYVELECPQCELDSFYNSELFDRAGVQLTCPHCGNILFDSDEDCLVMDDDDDL